MIRFKYFLPMEEVRKFFDDPNVTKVEVESPKRSKNRNRNTDVVSVYVRMTSFCEDRTSAVNGSLLSPLIHKIERFLKFRKKKLTYEEYSFFSGIISDMRTSGSVKMSHVEKYINCLLRTIYHSKIKSYLPLHVIKTMLHIEKTHFKTDAETISLYQDIIDTYDIGTAETISV